MPAPYTIDRASIDMPAPTGAEAGLIPVAYSREIIESAVAQSMVLSTFRRITMPTGVQNLPVLDVLPVAKWVTGEVSSATPDAGVKPATEQRWKGLVLTAEEVAAIVVIPEAVLEDASINLWNEITPRLGEAIGLALDLAAFLGTNKPASWPTAIIPASVAAGNVVVAAAGVMDGYDDAFAKVEADGYMVKQVYAGIGEMSGFRGWSAAGVPIYVSSLKSDSFVDSIYGRPVKYDEFNALGTTRAVVGDPSMALLGVRTDIQYKFLYESSLDVSAAQDGSAVINLAQQDSVGLRVRARFAFQVANPVNHRNPNAATRYPFAVINPT